LCPGVEQPDGDKLLSPVCVLVIMLIDSLKDNAGIKYVFYGFLDSDNSLKNERCYVILAL
jgi:hypothetical protein